VKLIKHPFPDFSVRLDLQLKDAETENNP
jgi:hypothetical protein